MLFLPDLESTAVGQILQQPLGNEEHPVARTNGPDRAGPGFVLQRPLGIRTSQKLHRLVE